MFTGEGRQCGIGTDDDADRKEGCPFFRARNVSATPNVAKKGGG